MCFYGSPKLTRDIYDRMSKNKTGTAHFYKVVKIYSRLSPHHRYDAHPLKYPRGETVVGKAGFSGKNAHRKRISRQSVMSSGIYVCHTRERAEKYIKNNLGNSMPPDRYQILKVSAHKDDLIGSGSIGYTSFREGHINVSCFNKVRVLT